MKHLPIYAAFAATLLSPVAAFAHGSAGDETVKVAADQSIPNIPGKRLVSLVVEYPPNGKSASHRHASSAFIYAHVLSGQIRSQVDDGPARVFHAGEGWFEKPGAHHGVSENASKTEPARLLATFIVDEGEEPLTIVDGH